MDMIQVDPKLFVTCRLCLEDLGQYQIVPSVQQQIKYCFDIEVEPFDGFPQLICMKCKEILNNFYTVKKTFSDKQTNLISKKDEICIQSQQGTVDSNQQATDSSQNVDEPKKKKMKKRRVLQSYSCSDIESEQSLHVTKHKKQRTSRHYEKNPMSWEADYKKQIACRLCNSIWSNKRSIWNHIRSHDLLKTRYKNILNRTSTVNLIKIDDKPNITGSSKMVVHNSNRIIAPGNSNFYTVYSKETDNVADHLDNDEPKTKYKESLSQDSTDDDEDIIFKPTKRKRRQLSRSSNETVVIASNSNKILSDCEDDSKITTHENIDELLSNDQCINIDDSSDSDSDRGKLDSSQRIKQPMEANLGDYKIIQGIISMCINSYQKKNESADVDISYPNVTQNNKKDSIPISSESQLKHKVLSIGRKIINKQGFNCTGLLRYMEHKNLEIVWMTKTLPSYTNKETNYIRILTKLRGRENVDDNVGWENVSPMSESMSFNPVPDNNPIQVAALNNVLSTVPVSNNSEYDTTVTKIATSQLANSETSQLEQVNSQVIDKMPASLYLDNKASSTELKKLLNANPVANPKQLPKKMGPGYESRSNKAVSHQNICHTNNDEVNYCLPIITSTTSLATSPNKEQNEDFNHNKSVPSEVIPSAETPVPRIKVKPVSELMSERTLNSLRIEQVAPAGNSNMLVSQIENVWPHQRPMNVFVPNMGTQMQVVSPHLQLVQQLHPNLNIDPAYQVRPSPTTPNKQDYVVLDTTDFPNTKTKSPFKYLKDLLQMHNLFLLDPCDTLSREFICLIKFRVQFNQEPNKDTPLVLCLSVYCLRNTFCLKVRDRNQDSIDINKISANWQWEILQIYRGDVINKVLLNAQKISQETFDSTNKFFCLLKSINCHKG